jgi:hypothetical protein
MQNRDLPNIHTQFSQIANGDLMLTITMGFESSTDFTAAKQSSAILDRKLLDKAIARAFDAHKLSPNYALTAEVEELRKQVKELTETVELLTAVKRSEPAADGEASTW